MKNHHSKRILLSSLFGFGILSSSHAATFSWTGSQQDKSWGKVTGDDGTNWSPNRSGIPDSNDDVVFGGAAASSSLSVKLAGDRTVNTVKFSRNDVGTSLYKLDVSNANQNTLFINSGLEVEKGEHRVYCHLQPQGSMTWIISNFTQNSELADGVLELYGELKGDSGLELVLEGGGGAGLGTFNLHKAINSFAGTLINRGVFIDFTSLGLSNAYYKHEGGSYTFTDLNQVTLRGLQTSTYFPNLTVGNGGLELTNTNNKGTPTSIGEVTFESLVLNGTFYCDVSGTSADKIIARDGVDLTNAFLEIRGDLDLYGEAVIATYPSRTGEFDVSGLPAGYSVRYEATQAVLVGVSPDVLYVDADATGAGTGYNWTDAFTSLQDAIDEAQTLYNQTGFLRQIWVADGVYYTDEGASQTNGNRSARFNLHGGISIYGGFAGGETALSQRDPSVNIAVLSGDLDKNDATNGDGVSESADDIVGTNAYKVVYVNYSSTAIYTTETRLDGFTLTGGQTDTVNGDRYISRGGALLVETSGSDNKPVFENCRFIGNYAFQGGGICVGTHAFADFVNCDIRGNRSNDIGGGMFNWRSSVNLTNCNVSGNIAGGDGGGVYDYMSGSARTTVHTNCTISGNISGGEGGGYATNLPASNTLNNVLIWNNQDSSGQASTTSTAMSLSNCLFEGVDLSGIGTANLNGTLSANDPLFFAEIDLAIITEPTVAGDHRLKKNSGAADGGNNSYISESEDLSGDQRVENGTVDIGAYELDVTAPVFTLLGDSIHNLEVDDTSTYVDPGFTVVDDRDGDIRANTTVIVSVNMGVPGFGSVTYFGSDAAGNAFSAGRTVRLWDTIKPTITAPADLANIEITSPSGVAVSLGTPTVGDNASADPTPSNNAPELFPLGTTNVSWTAQDTSGNISDADVQAVQVVDTTAPTFASLPLADVNVEYTGSPANASLAAPSVSDNGDASPVVTNNAPSAFPLGTTVVRWTVTDASGNSITADQNVIVADTTAPTITAPASIVGLEGNTSITDPSNSFNKIGGYAGLDIGAPTNVSDAVDSTVTVTNDAPSIFPLGTTTVTWSAIDDAGNVGQATQTVQVLDTVAPVLTLIDDAVLQFEEGANFTVPGATVFDVCDTDLQYTASPFLNAGSEAGVYTVTYNATDESGNAATPVERVVIVGAAPSSVYCVDDSSDFTVTRDIAPAGLSFGDTVTWNSPTGAVTGLTYGINAHVNLIEALDKVPNAGTIQIGVGTFEAGAVINIDKDVTITGSGADMTYLSGAGSYKIMDVIGGSLATHDITVEKLTMTNNGQNWVFKVSNLGQTRLNEVKFSGNIASAILIISGDVLLTNCEISGSVTTASLVQLGDVSGVYPTFINCTIAGNKCSEIGIQSNVAMARFENCVIYENKVENFHEISSTMEFRQCLIQGASSADFMAGNALNVGNIDATDSNNHPLFLKVDDFSALPSITGDYRIASNSPLVDQGDSTLNSRTEDLLGNVREVGASVDIGAHEVVDTGVQGGTGNFIYTDSTGLGSFELDDLVGDFSGSPTTYALASNSNPDLVGVSLVGSKVNVTLDQVGFASLRFAATNGASTGVHTIHFGVVASPVYVDADATGANTGLSWSDAFTNINDAILAQRPGTTQDVWIADGKYFPDDGRLKQEGDVEASIILTDGVRLYGGFSGVETDFSQRDTDANLTILSGDIDENDVDLNGDGVVDHHTGIKGENTYLMMHCDGVSFSTIVDGLVFTGGHSRARSGIYNNGPCMYARYSSLQLHDCLFQGNHGKSEGGFMYLEGNNTRPREHYQILVSDCQFIGNRSDDYSGIYIEDGVLSVENCQFLDNFGNEGYGTILYVDDATATLNHCEIRGNYTNGQGGVTYVEGGDVIFSNCLITGNTTSMEATVAYLNARSAVPVHVTFRSCTIAGNYCSNLSAGNSLLWVGEDSTLVFENSVVWQNDHIFGLTQETLIKLEGALEMRHSLVETFNETDANATSASSYGNMDGTLAANDPLFTLSPAANTAPFTGGDYHIPSNSPLIDGGENALNSEDYDLDGNPRIVNALIDIGAYEGAPSNYAKWIAQFYPNETDVNVIDRNADNGGNGLPNKLLFITNTDPRSITGGANVLTQTVDADYLVLDFPRRDDAAEFNPVIEWSTNLVDFFDSVHGISGVVISVEDDGYGTSADGVGVDKVEVRVPKNEAPRMFGRLKVN